MRGRESNPDRGPKVLEGEMKFDKGYTSDDEHVNPKTSFGTTQRGNSYTEMQNKITRSDDAKLVRGKNTRIQ
jgi:hypothetical protein